MVFASCQQIALFLRTPATQEQKHTTRQEHNQCPGTHHRVRQVRRRGARQSKVESATAIRMPSKGPKSTMAKATTILNAIAIFVTAI